MITAVARLFEAHLTVADLDRSIAFYRDSVGLDLAHVVPARQAAFFWIGSRGHAMLGLWAAGSAPQKTTMHIAFAAGLDDVIAAPQCAGDGHRGAHSMEPTDEPVVRRMPAASVPRSDGHLLEYRVLAGNHVPVVS